MSDLEQMVRALTRMPANELEEVRKQVETAALPWVPNPGPQTEAYFSKADVLLFGGEPGGGKTELLLGLAFNEHKRSLLMRRQYTNLTPLTDGAIRINRGREGYNGSAPPKLRLDRDRIIEFGAAQHPGDEQAWQGNPHDLIGIDEATQFREDQVRFLMGWLRSTDAGQRCRVVLATNPPLTSDGMWVVKMFAPWLDDRHPRPAKPCELRWYITDQDGLDVEVDGPESLTQWQGRDVRTKSGQPVKPLSRTFIPSSVSDNPYLASTDYQAKLDAMIEPFRSILLGKFKETLRDHPFQVIPTGWIVDAQRRWSPEPPQGVPMTAIGVDPVGGGADELAVAPRYDWWFAPIITVPGKECPLGRNQAGHVVMNRRDDADVIIDMGGGYGGGIYETLLSNGIKPIVYKGSTASGKRTKDRKLGFTNSRSATYWAFREALDPEQVGGSPVALPNDPELVADLTTLTFEVTPRGIQVLTKDKVVETLGRSPNKGDAVVMAWAAGAHGVAPLTTQFGREQYVAGKRGRTLPTMANLGPRHRNR